MQDLEGLKGVNLFRDLDAGELKKIMQTAKPFGVGSGQILCRQGERSGSVFVILRGSAQVTVEDPYASAVPVATLGPGDVFGELGLIDKRPRAATVVAESMLEGYELDGAKFNELRAALDPAAYKVLRRIALTVCDRLRMVNATAARQPVPTRRAAALDDPRADAESGRGFWKSLAGLFGG